MVDLAVRFAWELVDFPEPFSRCGQRSFLFQKPILSVESPTPRSMFTNTIETKGTNAFEKVSDGRGDRRTAGADPPQYSYRSRCIFNARETQRSCSIHGRVEKGSRRDQVMLRANRQVLLDASVSVDVAIHAAANPRRATAVRSPLPAIERRSTGDRRSTVLVASESHGECHAMMEPCRGPPPRPPARTTR